jgi:hypothetical protein
LGELVAVVRFELDAARGPDRAAFPELVAEDDVHRAVGAHHRDLGGGYAKFTSARMCLTLMTSYAPPYALRVITVTCGTVASANA